MKTKDEVYQFLNSLQWKRMTRAELNKSLQSFFSSTNKVEKNEMIDTTDIDNSFLFTTGTEECCTHNFIDIEIYYINTRKRGTFLITETTLLDYVE